MGLYFNSRQLSEEVLTRERSELALVALLVSRKIARAAPMDRKNLRHHQSQRGVV
jgi:hypothetical protein